MTTTPGMLIGGKWIARSEGDHNTRTIENPSTSQTICTVPEATLDEVRSAVTAACNAFDDGEWSSRPPASRGDVLRQMAQQLRASAADVALAECLDVGKPITQAQADVKAAIELLDYYASLTSDWTEHVVRNDSNQLSYVSREPVGVVASIVPWNYPLVLAVQSVATALAAGCTVVLKPSELTPASAILLSRIAAELIPPGVFNLVLGAGETVGGALVRSDAVDAVLFTGSTEVGVTIQQIGAYTMKRVSLELGGKSPTIVMADAPFDAAVDNALMKISINQGENCGAGSRLLLQRDIAADFLDALCERAAKLQIGDPLDPDTDIGPMISADHKERVNGYMEYARSEGVKLFELSVPDELTHQGHFVPLTFWDCGPGTRLWKEEVFGPVLTVQLFNDEDDAVALANDTHYGLMAMLWTGAHAAGIRMAQRIRAGVIRINEGVEPMQGPWGGYKMSGIGRSSGHYAFDTVTELKLINVGLAS
jgi:betaine-aldehyde dehydrogenase